MISNKDLLLEYFTFYQHSKASVKMRKSSLRTFFGKHYAFGNGNGGEFFNYKGHVFDIDITTLKKYFIWLKNLDSVSITTRRNKWNILTSFLESVMEDYDDFLVKIPRKRVSWRGAVNKDGVKRGNHDTFATKEELQKLLQYFKTANFKHYLIFRLLVETGARKGEIIKLKLNELDLEERSINPHQGKTGEKYYFFSEELASDFKLYVPERKKIDTTLEYFFLTRYFERYNSRTFNSLLEYAQEKLDMDKKITCQTFRRTLNDYRKQMGCNLEDRKVLLGHAVRDVNVKSYSRNDISRHRALRDKFNPYKDINF